MVGGFWRSSSSQQVNISEKEDGWVKSTCGVRLCEKVRWFPKSKAESCASSCVLILYSVLFFKTKKAKTHLFLYFFTVHRFRSRFPNLKWADRQFSLIKVASVACTVGLERISPVLKPSWAGFTPNPQWKCSRCQSFSVRPPGVQLLYSRQRQMTSLMLKLSRSLVLLFGCRSPCHTAAEHVNTVNYKT